jgi:hypothetical protein
MKTREELINELDQMIQEYDDTLNARFPIDPEYPLILAIKHVRISLSFIFKEVFTEIREMAENETEPEVIIANGLRKINDLNVMAQNALTIDWEELGDDPDDLSDDEMRDMAKSFFRLLNIVAKQLYEGIPELLDPDSSNSES